MNRLEQRRLDKGMSRQQLAEAAGVNYKTVLDLESDEPGEPQVSTRSKIAKELGLRPSELLLPAVWADREVA